MAMMIDQEILPVVMITILVLVQGDLVCPIRMQVGETVTDILTEMVVVIRVLEIDPADQAMKTTTLKMILYYN